MGGHHQRAGGDPLFRLGRLYRHDLLLSALHGPAALFDAGEDGPSLLEAAADLGSRPFKSFLSITLPLSLPGIIAGSLLVFIPAVGEFVTPELLGGPDTLMIGRVLWNEFFANRDWPVASAVAIALLLVLVVPIMIFQHVQGKQAEAGQ